MNLSDFSGHFEALQFPSETEDARPPRDQVRRAQEALEEALRTDAFIADCFEHELRVLDQEKVRSGLPPFLVLPGLGIRMSLAYWAPGQDVGAHEHTDWTVTAVCHNALEVEVYDRRAALDENRLVQTNRHSAPAGKAGHIYDPCVHNPRNTTQSWSMSIHILSPHDGKPVDGREPFSDRRGRRMPRAPKAPAHAFTRSVVARQRQRFLRVLARVLERCGDTRAPTLLEEVFNRSNASTRRLVCSAMARRDPARAQHLSKVRDAMAFSLDTRLEPAMSAIAREVHVHDGHADLIAHTPDGPVLLVRVNDWASDALRVLAREDSLVVRDIPGSFSDDQRLALVEALDDWALFRVERHAAAHIPAA